MTILVLMAQGVESTGRAFGERGHIICLIEKKAFKGPERQALVAFIEGELGLPVAFNKAQVREARCTIEAMD
jgi:hypothetical protein